MPQSKSSAQRDETQRRNRFRKKKRKKKRVVRSGNRCLCATPLFCLLRKKKTRLRSVFFACVTPIPCEKEEENKVVKTAEAAVVQLIAVQKIGFFIAPASSQTAPHPSAIKLHKTASKQSSFREGCQIQSPFSGKREREKTKG